MPESLSEVKPGGKTGANDYLLAGDIGGTKTLLGLYRPAGFPDSLLHKRKYLNRDAGSLEELIASFLQGTGLQPRSCCLGVAGPVLDNKVQMTNASWRINGINLKKQFGFNRVLLINDLEAMAAGALLLGPTDRHTLNPGQPAVEGAIGILAVGTGLGQAFIIREQGRNLIRPSEGGHASFAPRNREQIALLTWLLSQEKHVSVEKVCSGMGIQRLYDFQRTRLQEPLWIRQSLLTASDRTPAIVQAGLDQEQSCPPARAALTMLVDILAAEAANVALKMLTTGGIFIGGGLALRILPIFDHENFMQYFRRGTYAAMLAKIPVHIITNPETGLLGAAAMGLNRSM